MRFGFLSFGLLVLSGAIIAVDVAPSLAAASAQTNRELSQSQAQERSEQLIACRCTPSSCSCSSRPTRRR
jgi:hypothetical protein